MIRSGLVSITFRHLDPPAIVALCVRANTPGIEWGGDVHAPPGAIGTARRIARLTRDAGLTTAAYGSYYTLGGDEGDRFRYELETAQALGAPLIRVWAGRRGSVGADAEHRRKVRADLERVSAIAAESAISIALEFHENTLTDSAESALDLVGEQRRPNVSLYWQTTNRAPSSHSLETLKSIRHHVSNAHVFNWEFSEAGVRRRPLAAAKEQWRQYLEVLNAEPSADRFALLEFVTNDDPEQFVADAATLNGLLAELASAPSSSATFSL